MNARTISQTDKPAPIPTMARCTLQLEPSNVRRMASLCGASNSHLRLIADGLGVVIRHRGERLQMEGTPDLLERAKSLLHQLYRNTENGGELSPDDVHLAILENKNGGDGKSAAKASQQADSGQEGPTLTTPKKKIRPISAAQRRYVQALLNSELCFGVGPAGVGKTWLATAAAVQCLKAGEVERIVLVRPAVEAGERLGFLPGDMTQKIEPYQKPLYDALFEFLGQSMAERLIEEGVIEVLPLAYMRGRTLNHAFVLLDESQNATIGQMKMLLTRMGNGSRVVVNGDPSQCDLPPDSPSGLLHAVELLTGLPSVSVVYLDESSVVRHPLVSRIISAYGNGGNQNGSQSGQADH